LDVDLSEAGLTTKSANFDAVMAASRTSRLQEEMRVFYVAVTRAQHAVAFVVSGQGGVTHPPTHRDYSWADELRRRGPHFHFLGRSWSRGELGSRVAVGPSQTLPASPASYPAVRTPSVIRVLTLPVRR